MMSEIAAFFNFLDLLFVVGPALCRILSPDEAGYLNVDLGFLFASRQIGVPEDEHEVVIEIFFGSPVLDQLLLSLLLLH